MQKFYIAGIVPESAETGGGYSVYFPDLPNVAAGGETIEEAIGNAADGLYLALRGIVEMNGEIPAPSALETVRERVKAEREQDALPCPKDTLYQYIAAPTLDMVPVRVNVTIPKSSLEEIDAKARKYGYTRSGFLARAALEYTQ
jgi:predicted RNase H-like HicB family nuclease